MKLAQKGMQREQELSASLHQKYQPILVSAKLLRSRGCGQIDLAYNDGRTIHLVEVKHRDSYGLGPRQYSRLKKSNELLCKFFTRPVVLEVKN